MMTCKKSKNMGVFIAVRGMDDPYIVEILDRETFNKDSVWIRCTDHAPSYLEPGGEYTTPKDSIVSTFTIDYVDVPCEDGVWLVLAPDNSCQYRAIVNGSLMSATSNYPMGVAAEEGVKAICRIGDIPKEDSRYND